MQVGAETLSPRQRITSAAFSIVSENSRLLNGSDSSAFASATHSHGGADITSGTVAEARIGAAITRDSEIVPAVLANDGTGSTFDADLLDGSDSSAFASATHGHDGGDIATGTVAEVRIDAAIARDSEIVPTVLANDGAGSGLDADTVDGVQGADLEESAEIDADITAHAVVTDAHHAKTTSFSELTDTAADAQIPPAIARDAEVNSEMSAHGATADAHHARYTDAGAVGAMGAKSAANPLHHDKTTSFTELTDPASDAQIPTTIARDTEVDSKITDHAAVTDAHHAKTTSFAELTDTATDAQIPDNISINYAASAGDADTVDGMHGAVLEESAEIDADIAAHAAVVDGHHARYTDSESVTAMGAKANTNPLHHDKTTSFSGLTGTAADAQIPATIARDAEVASGIATHGSIADAHHARYTGSEAVAAMGAKSNGNPLHHDKTTSLSWGSITSIPAGFADGIDNDSGGTRWSLTGNSGTSPGTHFLGTTNNVALQLHVNNARAFRLEPNATSPNVIGGYSANSVTAGVLGATIGGGGAPIDALGGPYPNRVTGNWGTVGGGWDNTASVLGASVGGGQKNTGSGNRATVGGGYKNTASGALGTVGGGQLNTASASEATVGGGQQNTASGSCATVGGGWANTAGTWPYATVGGGSNNTASKSYATVGGGLENTAGYAATVAGGEKNAAAGDWSFAAGYRAKANHKGSFVWADSTYADFASVRQDHFHVKATGGVGLNVNSGWVEIWVTGNRLILTSTGAWLSTAGIWTNASDRNAKENFAPVDEREVLARLAQMPITTWNHKAEDTSTRHMGPMAQDFHAAFGLGSDDKSIGTLDATGVAFAAIQGLHQIVEEKDARIVTLEKQNGEVEARLTALEALVETLVQERQATGK